VLTSAAADARAVDARVSPQLLAALDALADDAETA
jgi:hypothetical protein